MKRITLFFALLIISLPLSAQGTTEETKTNKIVASTSWTAAFADLGGLDDVPFIAPATMVHPPEYEITVEDVVTIDQADYFIYAGYERMMQTIGASIKKDESTMVQINTNNSIENVIKQAKVIAQLMGTEKVSEERVNAYVLAVQKGSEQVQKQGLKGVKVYCHSMQVYLAQDLGLSIAGTFGPGPVTANQIAEMAKQKYPIIIDNVHNPIAQPLLDVSPTSKLVIWRNFPQSGERGSLQKMVEQNIEALLR